MWNCCRRQSTINKKQWNFVNALGLIGIGRQPRSLWKVVYSIRSAATIWEVGQRSFYTLQIWIFSAAIYLRDWRFLITYYQSAASNGATNTRYAYGSALSWKYLQENYQALLFACLHSKFRWCGAASMHCHCTITYLPMLKVSLHLFRFLV